MSSTQTPPLPPPTGRPHIVGWQQLAANSGYAHVICYGISLKLKI